MMRGFGAMLPALLLPLLAAPCAALDFGLNLPCMNGTSGTGAFQPGVYNLSYGAAQLAHMRQLGFDSVRLPVNIVTANDPAALATMRALVQGVGGSAVICMFGTGSLTTHGTGRIDSLPDAIGAWSKVHAALGDLPGVKYEIFNEPHGYSLGCNSPPCGTPASYLRDMRAVIAGAKLPEDRCVLDALGWAADPQTLSKLGWGGSIGYHFYSWWLPANSTRQEFSALFQLQLHGLSDRVYVTEFGGSLDSANQDYEQPTTTDNSVNCLQGMDDAVQALRKKGKGIKGAFHWHGWMDGDSFSLFGAGNSNGRAKVLKVLEHCCGAAPAHGGGVG